MAKKKTLKKLGRPTKAEGPRFPPDTVDRLLVEGEEVPTTRGRVKRRFPSFRELAQRFGVAHSAIARYAEHHDCLGRRKRLLAGPQRATLPPSEALPPPPPAQLAPPAPVEELPPPLPAQPAPVEELPPPPPAQRKTGRPRKSEEPALPRQELDRALVFGDVTTLPDGSTMTDYASYRELAERFGVATSLVATYSKEHNCLRRREEAKVRIATKADQKLIELRANAIAVSKDDALKMIDGYLLGFEEALAEGRVRVDNPTDFNTMVRLKEFVQGGADSRQELHASFSLEGLQARHAQALRAARETTPAVRGEVDAEVVSSGDEDLDTASPGSTKDDALMGPPTDVAPPADPD
ncbi:AT hook motif domain protein [Myxococcus llanfairpwllgwyngyllgogerychwyrndrobwllllantysiliogogogochensis]|uniref:AT hook motif domain protein n=1 Tax=Myxococcus llanfairpwllgwyngyllgogerychwyrndrobwllllantysiliogogogochensis TaxID=2590453 RepID=A0A540WI77_9BACT|nr:AT hook motif domain protein [Myxococcus llanfairpwllgwyngyllgogerychwyrndrobwllllantysiliogogogochensis]TQF08702.1 AT hook motif domain protein [Myxococcus llanfairpwllgwyngyllgogerychwyrndrobwllllantysiliogogogochensis]